jgi:hypothetical protein
MCLEVSGDRRCLSLFIRNVPSAGIVESQCSHRYLTELLFLRINMRLSYAHRSADCRTTPESEAATPILCMPLCYAYRRNDSLKKCNKLPSNRVLLYLSGLVAK